MNHARWNLLPPAPAPYLAQTASFPPLIAQFLYNRGLTEPSQLELFLNADERLSGDPFLLPDMHQAVARIYQALLSGESIAIYGDFDADGITATAVLVKGLEQLGARVTPYIPHRMNEGHGLRTNTLERLQQQGISAKIGLCEAEPAISNIRVTDDGMLWVLTPAGTQDQPEEIMATYDVFDAQGHFVKQVAAGCPGDGENDALFPAGEDRLIKVTDIIAAAVAMQGGLGAAGDEEAEPMEVVCYRIVD